MSFTTKRSHTIIIVAFILILFATIVISINAGYKKIPVLDILKVFIGQGSNKHQLIILDFRLPRIVISILIGCGFAVSGCVLQGVVKNPLADPGLIGINSGAGIIVVFLIAIGTTKSMGSIFLLPFLSLLGALIIGVIIYGLSYQKDRGVIPSKLILNGIAIQAGINAITTMIIVTLDDTQYDFIAKWQSGSIWNSNWQFVVALLPWIITGYLYITFKARNLDILIMGDDISVGLGLSLKKDKMKLLFTATAMAASSVAVAGSMSFIGLIAPHISKKLVGHRHRILIPTCALVGSSLVLIADTIARKIIEPSEIPTGIVVSVIGAPYFIYLLINQKKYKRSK